MKKTFWYNNTLYASPQVRNVFIKVQKNEFGIVILNIQVRKSAVRKSAMYSSKLKKMNLV